MKIVTLQSNLKNGLSAVERSISESNTLPVLKNVLIKTYNNQIKISATNLELGISRYISGKIIEEGGITVPFNTLYHIVNNSDSEKINLEVKDSNLLIKTDNYEAKIQCISPDEYPLIPKIESTDNYLEIKNSYLQEALNKVLPCCQTSEIRPEISGVLFDFQMTLLKLVATDSFRLAEKTIPSSFFRANFTRGFKVIIPLKTIREYVRVFPQNEFVKIYIDPSQIYFQSNDFEMISRLIDGEYPDYEQIIPRENETECILSREYLLNAIKLVSSLSGKVNDVVIKIGENKKTLSIYSSNPSVGENRYIVPAKIHGKGFDEIHFNWRFLLDGLRTLDSDDVVFDINEESRPAIIKSKDDLNFFYVVMPIKV